MLLHVRFSALFLLFTPSETIWQRGSYTIITVNDDNTANLALGGEALRFASAPPPNAPFQLPSSGAGPWGDFDELSFLDGANRTLFSIRYHGAADAFTFHRAAEFEDAWPFFNASTAESASAPLIFYTNDYMVPGFRSTLSACAAGPTPQYTDGALFLFSRTQTPAGLHPALAFSPLDNFTTQSAICVGGGAPRAGFGGATGEACVGWPCAGRSYAPAPPPGARPFSSILVGRPSLKRATMAWGALLRRAYNATRARGAGTRSLSYVTSNAAGYSFWSTPQNLSVWGVPEDIFGALARGYAAAGVPVRQWEVDTQFTDPLELWPGAGWCFKQWANWSTALFPSGPLALRDALRNASSANVSFMYYVQGFCQDTVYAQRGWRFVNVGRSPRWEPPAAVVHPDDARSFYSSILSPAAAAWGMQHLFADFVCMRGPRLAQALPGYYGAEEAWLRGFTSAAGALGMEVQLCMSCAHQALASLSLPAVTNFRASNDGGLDPTELVFSSVLIAAVGAAWSKDNLRLRAWGPGTTELQTLLAALSCGPVQLGDVLEGFPAPLPRGASPPVVTNATLALSTCASDGTLLQPSFPLTPIEPLLAGGEGGLDVGAGHVLATFTAVPGAGACPWFTAIGYTASATAPPAPPPFNVTPAHLAPMVDATAPAPPDVGAVPTGSYAGDGAAPPPCAYVAWRPGRAAVEPWGNGAPAALPLLLAAPSQVNFAPALGDRAPVLLGEARKAAAVSAFRFAFAGAAPGGGLALRLRGAPGERVELLLARPPNATIDSVAVVLNSTGGLELVL